MASVNDNDPPPPPPVGDGPTGSKTTLRTTANSENSATSEIKEFRHKITEKLHDENFVLWCQQVEPVIKAHHLHRFVASPTIPPRFLTNEDIASNNENPDFLDWEAQDQMLLSWLQTTLSTAIQARVVGCTHSFELWDKIYAYFQKLGRTKIRQLRNELRSTQLENTTVKEYLAKIKSLVDALAAVGSPVSAKDHLDAILDALPQEYDQIISIVESRFDDDVTVEEAESLLLVIAQAVKLD